jgi:hypothetical protein
VDRCGNKNAHQIDMCLKEIGLHVQNLLIVLFFYFILFYYFLVFRGGGKYMII